MNADLRNATYDELIDFVFNHYPEDEVDDKWYWKELDDEIQIEPRHAIAFITRLCNNSSDLLGRFTMRQIGEGVMFVFGARAATEFLEQLWNFEVPWNERLDCIRSIPQLYAQVFEREPDAGDDCAYMLWDLIAYGYFAGTRNPLTSAEDARVQDAMFEALVSMLDSDHPETLCGAIHGLGHLVHRDGNRAIRALLSSTRTLTPAVRGYAANVLEGHFQ